MALANTDAPPIKLLMIRLTSWQPLAVMPATTLLTVSMLVTADCVLTVPANTDVLLMKSRDSPNLSPSLPLPSAVMLATTLQIVLTLAHADSALMALASTDAETVHCRN